jgi:hypothetical protein
MSRDRKKKRGSLNTGWLLIGVGSIFLLIEMDILPSMEHSWPLLLIIVGVLFLLAARKREDGTESLVEPALPAKPASTSALPPPAATPADSSQTET